MRSPLLPVRLVPDDVAARYREAGLWTGETFPAFFDDRLRRFADRTAVVGVDAHGAEVRWTYAELDRASLDAAARLSSCGVDSGDRVVVALPNIVEYVAVITGLFRMGALPVFGLPTHRELELAQFCQIADAAAIVVATEEGGPDRVSLHEATVARLTGATPVLVDVATWAPMGRESGPSGVHGTRAASTSAGIAFLQLSGGTTGISKLIPRTHDDYLYSVRASVEICGVTSGTVMLVSLPAAHNFAMSSPGILGVLHAGGTVVLARDPSPGTAFRLIERERVTMASLVPPLVQAWISAARRRNPDLSSLELVQVGGARLADTVASEVGPVLGAGLQQVFGMAEGLVNYTRLDDPLDLVTSTQGRPISAYDEIRLVDADDRDVPPGEEGSLLTRGPYTIRGYYGSPQADADSFTEDGFYRTGDLVRQLPSGHLIVTGRDKDQINRGGEKVATDELEGLALTHPSVLDAVAVGVPDPYLGERIALVVRLEPGAATESIDLRAHLTGAGLASHKSPDDVVVLDAFPETHVGKNSRRELRRLLADDLTTGVN
ncbi:(2,3-dihydroxybenzoyl)adenylate synthase [Nocardioides sp. Kera G14]|uniref:(2,3-dihydroxybenzoyl)adenylate synthase n=1 Tax=Nocardioides sp. Kera G14 TaxID=2884264 RepID=UPI001D1031C2|nr:AMP-binding protein [Nocardioides sp. Kera G14]UDY24265.1 AMP-binding protein [Nocardioides sp. Kera G14]